MKIKQVYVCEKCHQSYDTEEAALQCEIHHCLPVSVSVLSNYKIPIDETQDGHPRYVVVEMSNHDLCLYKFEKTLPMFE